MIASRLYAPNGCRFTIRDVANGAVDLNQLNYNDMPALLKRYAQAFVELEDDMSRIARQVDILTEQFVVPDEENKKTI